MYIVGHNGGGTTLPTYLYLIHDANVVVARFQRSPSTVTSYTYRMPEGTNDTLDFSEPPTIFDNASAALASFLRLYNSFERDILA